MGVQNATTMTLSPNMNRTRANMRIDHAADRYLEVLEGLTDEVLVFDMRDHHPIEAGQWWRPPSQTVNGSGSALPLRTDTTGFVTTVRSARLPYWRSGTVRTIHRPSQRST
ncbi:hypothetical protein ACFOW9_07505 [Arthrobacter cryoconiti]|uniref:Uncharacterized protein n=1 Tax=Arthrobacter cryoconiti TaxID=748907 RepID=A0ABV8QYX1_9MICC|nr:hypothetical protein [Arthrobacter cryoconiti]